MLLGALIALDAARVVVFGLALLVGELDSAHTAVPGIEHIDVVDEAAEDAGTAGGVRTDPVPVHRNELLVLRGSRGHNTGQRQAQQGCLDCLHNHPPRKVSLAKRNE